MLEAGVKAPDFRLQDKDVNLVSLSDFKIKKVVYISTLRIVLQGVLSKHVHLEIILIVLNQKIW